MGSPRAVGRISAGDLSRLLLEKRKDVAVVDVRDDDHVGGHIRGSIHCPSASLGPRLPGLIKQLQDKKNIVFHCALSQQRGPVAAARYLQELEAAETFQEASMPSQQVYVLDLGFVGWQKDYGKDARLTEAYAEDVWADN